MQTVEDVYTDSLLVVYHTYVIWFKSSSLIIY